MLFMLGLRQQYMYITNFYTKFNQLKVLSIFTKGSAEPSFQGLVF